MDEVSPFAHTYSMLMYLIDDSYIFSSLFIWRFHVCLSHSSPISQWKIQLKKIKWKIHIFQFLNSRPVRYLADECVLALTVLHLVSMNSTSSHLLGKYLNENGREKIVIPPCMVCPVLSISSLMKNASHPAIRSQSPSISLEVSDR